MSHRIEVRVYYEDTDMAGIVYYANYLKFMERARTEAVRAAGIGQQALRDEAAIVFAVRRVEIEYLGPARLDDLLTVETRLKRMGAATLEMVQTVRRGETALTQADIKIACMSVSGKAMRIPADIRVKLAAILE